MAKIKGSFVFRNEGDGCLTSKYLNQDLDNPVTECCTIKEKKSEQGNSSKYEGPFCGEYYSVWFDFPGKSDINQATLEITKRTIGSLYDLIWTINGKPFYEGRGMLFDGLLTGCYWSV